MLSSWFTTVYRETGLKRSDLVSLDSAYFGLRVILAIFVRFISLSFCHILSRSSSPSFKSCFCLVILPYKSDWWCMQTFTICIGLSTVKEYFNEQFMFFFLNPSPISIVRAKYGHFHIGSVTVGGYHFGIQDKKNRHAALQWQNEHAKFFWLSGNGATHNPPF